VGYYSTSGSSAFGFHGFLHDQGVFITLDPPGAIGGSFAFGINDYGQVVGHYYSDSQSLKSHGFLYDQGVFTTIDVPGAFGTFVYGINNHGQIVGHYSTIYEGDHGFVYDAGTFTTIDVLGTNATGPRGINNHGQVSGFYISGGRPYGFLYDQGVFTTIDVPGFSFTVGFGINDYRQIAGYYYDSSDRVQYGFLYDQGVFTKLHPPGAFDTLTYGINNDGQIVGYYTDSSFVTHNFVATPVPVDKIPPVITVAASPTTLWPPNGKRVAVTVVGTITDTEPGGSGVKAGSAAYVVMDEYGQIQPHGSLTLGADGSYTFTVALEASRRGNDQDGRH
jgi:probable HAF family extracellular repeat protein